MKQQRTATRQPSVGPLFLEVIVQPPVGRRATPPRTRSSSPSLAVSSTLRMCSTTGRRPDGWSSPASSLQRVSPRRNAVSTARCSFTQEFVRGVVHVQGRGSLADAHQVADLPRDLALHGPTQRLQLTRRQRRGTRHWHCRCQDSKRSLLRMDREQLLRRSPGPSRRVEPTTSCWSSSRPP